MSAAAVDDLARLEAGYHADANYLRCKNALQRGDAWWAPYMVDDLAIKGEVSVVSADRDPQ
ncbi:hypothetical protein [Devosia sp. DBB001]|nr:hypothetical protein [Devosia sp. DBB001]